jgi:PAS domain S-box-containing protein
MEIDVPTLAFTLGITHLMQVLVFIHQYRVNKVYNGVGWWLAWSAVVVVGFLAMVLRLYLPFQPILIILQNSMLVSGTLFLYIGIMRFFEKQINIKLITGILILFFAGFLTFLFIHNDIRLRSFFINGTLSAISILTAYSLLKYKLRSVKMSAIFMASVFFIHGAIFMVRTIMLSLGEPVGNIFEPRFFNFLPLLDALVVSLMWTFGFIIMLNQRLTAEMSETQKDLQLIFNTSPDAAVITSMPDGLMVEVNEGYCQISGYRRDELIGKTTREMNIWKYLDDREKIIAKLKADGFCDNIETTFICKDGSEIIGLISAKVITLHEVPHIISITRDITQIRKNEEEIKELNQTLEKRVDERTKQLLLANKELESFSYSISHDLRTPLRAINGFAQILSEDYGDKLDDQAKRYCSVIGENAVKMGLLIDDLLTFSRFGRSEMNQARINMRGILDGVISEVQEASNPGRTNIDIHNILDAKGDSSMIKQVWFNLVSNAIKFSSKKEQIEIIIASRQEGGKIIYSVTDNGAGFDPEFSAKLFKVFQRLHSTEEFEGTGVGLAIVQRIIHRHGGEVWAEGEIDKGAAFYFSLPAMA